MNTEPSPPEPLPETGKTVDALLAEATPEAAAQLLALAENAPDKAARKAARAALYRLGQRGVTPAETAARLRAAATTGNPQARDATERLRAYASAFDGEGNYLLFFLVPDRDGGHSSLLQILSSDILGVREFRAQRFAPRDLNEILDWYRRQLETGTAWAEIESGEGLARLEEARRTTREAGRVSPPGFLDVAARLGDFAPATTPGAPPASAAQADTTGDDAETPTKRADAETEKADALAAALDPASAALFALPWFEPWFLSVQDVLLWLLDWRKASEANDAPRQAQVVADAAREMMISEVRARYQTRLERSAAILRLRGEENAARLAELHAGQLAAYREPSEEKAEEAELPPFLLGLTRRTLDAGLEIARAEAEKQGVKFGTIAEAGSETSP